MRACNISQPHVYLFLAFIQPLVPNTAIMTKQSISSDDDDDGDIHNLKNLDCLVVLDIASLRTFQSTLVHWFSFSAMTYGNYRFFPLKGCTILSGICKIFRLYFFMLSFQSTSKLFLSPSFILLHRLLGTNLIFDLFFLSLVMGEENQ